MMQLSREKGIDTSETSQEDNRPDPRLSQAHEEFEKMNIASDMLNKLQVQLGGAKTCFQEVSIRSETLEQLSEKYNKAIAEVRLYEAKIQEHQARKRAENSLIRSKLSKILAEEALRHFAISQDRLTRENNTSPEALEILDHHMRQIKEAEVERTAAEDEHRQMADSMVELTESIEKMENENRSSVKNSKLPTQSREFTKELKRQKEELILRLQNEIRQRKSAYSTSLQNLKQMSNAMHEQSAPSSYEEGEKDVTDHMGYTAVDPAACMISEDLGERAGRGIVQAERYHHLSVLQKCVPEKKILELCDTVFYSDSCGDMFLRPCPGDPRLSKYHPEASAHLERVHQEQTVKVSKEKEIEPWDLKNPTKVYRPTRSVLEDSVYDQHPEFGFGYR